MPHPHPQTAVFIQDLCYQHQYIRSKDHSTIVERPERLRAVKVGIAGALARLEELNEATQLANSTPSPPSSSLKTTDSAYGTIKREEDLSSALEKLTISSSSSSATTVGPVRVVHTGAALDLLNHPAVKFVHGDVDGDVYLENLTSWAKQSWEKVSKGESEIPANLPQGDLYLCPESVNAIQGALGAVCEAVDTTFAPKTEDESIKRSFVVVRPPGHHCGEDTPCGFCFVNNVMVGAAHAHLKHGVRRVVVLDIDLHHGNGTQSIVWQINEETYRRSLESEAEAGGEAQSKPDGLIVYYGSIHDILSFPCEDGKPELIQAASTSIHGAHGQYIENVHLAPYESEEAFWDHLYPNIYKRVLEKAEEFLVETGGAGDDVLFFISCGMDACEHEYPSMSRHNRKVPTSFYYRFTKDACALSQKYAQGRVVSVLEGGYSDRALASGAMAHVCGLVGEEANVNEEWWAIDNLVELETKTKRTRGAGGKSSTTASPAKAAKTNISNQDSSSPSWLDRSLAIFRELDRNSAKMSTLPKREIPTSSTMTLRDRKSLGKGSVASSPEPNVSRTAAAQKKNGDSEKKLPRVILKLGPKPEEDG